MKKFAFFFAVLSLITSTAFAVAFSPDVLRITAAPNIQYNFDGSTLSIPVTISGTPANLFFLSTPRIRPPRSVR